MDFWLSICHGGRIREISRNMAVIVGNVRVCAMAKECRDYRRVTHARVFDSFEVSIVSCVASADDSDILGAECLDLICAVVRKHKRSVTFGVARIDGRAKIKERDDDGSMSANGGGHERRRGIAVARIDGCASSKEKGNSGSMAFSSCGEKSSRTSVVARVDGSSGSEERGNDGIKAGSRRVEKRRCAGIAACVRIRAFGYECKRECNVTAINRVPEEIMLACGVVNMALVVRVRTCCDERGRDGDVAASRRVGECRHARFVLGTDIGARCEK